MDHQLHVLIDQVYVVRETKQGIGKELTSYHWLVKLF